MIRNTSIWIILMLALVLLFAGCEKHDDSDGTDPVTVDDDDSADDDDDDTAPADDDDADNPFTETFTVDLTFEMRGSAFVNISVTDENLTAVFTALDDYDLIAAGTQLSGDGKVYSLDGGLTLYAFRLEGPAVADSLCGNEKRCRSLFIGLIKGKVKGSQIIRFPHFFSKVIVDVRDKFRTGHRT